MLRRKDNLGEIASQDGLVEVFFIIEKEFFLPKNSFFTNANIYYFIFRIFFQSRLAYKNLKTVIDFLPSRIT